jgi:predicted Zn-dependent peptidase
MPDTFAGFSCQHVHDVPVLWRHDPRFKTFRFAFCARRPLDERMAARMLLPALLMRGTNRHADRPALARACERLYGAAVSPAVGRFSESAVLRLGIEAVAGAFLPEQPDQLGTTLGLLAEIATAPRLDGDGFPEVVFARERQLALAEAAAVFDDKAAWARQRALLQACRGEPYAIPERGDPAVIAALGREDPERQRQDFLGRGQLWCVAMGALPDDLPARLGPLLGGLPPRQPEPVPLPRQPPRRAAGRSVEHAPMQQGKQVLVFRFPAPREPAALCALQVFTNLLGGGSHSRLFKEVREARSLAYYTYAVADGHKGLMLVQTGLDAAHADEVETEVLRQVQALAAGDFTATELQTAIATIIGPFAAVDDSLASRMQFVGEQWLLGQDQTPAEKLATFRGISREQVVAVAAGMWHDHSYLLAPEAA